MAEVRPIDANALDLNDIPCNYGCNCDLDNVEAWVSNAPTLDYAPVTHAHVVWKERFRGGFEHNVTIVDNMGISHIGTLDARHYEKTPYCSRCGLELGVSSLNYCPNCGAKMKEGAPQ